MAPELDIQTMPGIEKLEFGFLTAIPPFSICTGTTPGCASNYVGALRAPLAGEPFYHNDPAAQGILEETVAAIQAAWLDGQARLQAVIPEANLCTAFTDDGPTIVAELSEAP